VAERCGVPLAEVLEHYRDLDAVADAWFRRAWAAMLAPPPGDFATRTARERLHLMTMRWFDALAPHRVVTGQMLAAKLYPSHPHHWMPLVFNLSRSIHWLREAALLDATGRRRQIEELGLTALFLATLTCWLRDDTPDQARTRRFLQHRLKHADRLMMRAWGNAPPPGIPIDPDLL
jgi:AcrR family transcriptional regulator